MLATSDGDPPNTLGRPGGNRHETGRGQGGKGRILTGVKMAVKVNHRDGAVRPVDGPEQGEGDRVVSAEGDDARQCLALLGEASLLGSRLGLPCEDCIVALFNLLQSPRVVVAVCCQHIEHLPGVLDTDDVTGMSPQSRTVAQLLNGFVSRGTL